MRTSHLSRVGIGARLCLSRCCTSFRSVTLILLLARVFFSDLQSQFPTVLSYCFTGPCHFTLSFSSCLSFCLRNHEEAPVKLIDLGIAGNLQKTSDGYLTDVAWLLRLSHAFWGSCGVDEGSILRYRLCVCWGSRWVCGRRVSPTPTRSTRWCETRLGVGQKP